MAVLENGGNEVVGEGGLNGVDIIVGGLDRSESLPLNDLHGKNKKWRRYQRLGSSKNKSV